MKINQTYKKIIFITLFYFIDSLFVSGENNKQNNQDSMNILLKDQIVEDLGSADSEVRLKAVKEIIKSKDDYYLRYIYQILIIETSDNIIQEILSFIEIEKSQSQFAPLFIFFKKTVNVAYKNKALSILRGINSSRLLYELSKIFKEEKLKINFLIFAKIVSEPSSEEKEWFQETFLKYEIGNYLLSYSQKEDAEIVQALSNFIVLNDLVKSDKLFNIFWAYMLDDIKSANNSIDLNITDLIQEVEKLPPHRIWQALNLIQKYSNKSININLFNISSSHIIKSWIYANKINENKTIEINSDEHNSISSYWIIASKINNISQNERKEFINLCETNILFIEPCFRAFLVMNLESTYEKWKKINENNKVSVFKKNYTHIFKNQNFNNKKFLRWFLGNNNELVKIQGIMHIPSSWIKENIDIFYAYYLSETNKFIGRLILYRLNAENEISIF